jgi:hypothetical protein
MATQTSSESEMQLQFALADYLETTDFLWNASKTGANVGPKLGAIYKRMGVRKGWPDVEITEIGGRGEPGLYLELKSKGHSLSIHQRAVRDRLRARGYVVEEAKTINACKAIIERYLSGTGEPFERTIPGAPQGPESSFATTPMPATVVAPRQRGSSAAGSSHDPVVCGWSDESESE